MSVERVTARKVADGLLFGEGIRWRGDRIVLSDMIGCRVVQVTPEDGTVETLLEVPEQPNGLAVGEDGDLFVLSMFDRTIMRRASDGSVSTHVDLSSIATGYLGDVVNDAAGNLYVDDVGSRVLHGEPPAANGRVIRVSPDGQAKALLTGLAFPNGIVISPDGQRLYLSQSRSEPPAIYLYDLANDRLDNERVFVTPPGPTDGMAIDDAEGIWACVLSGDPGIHRYDRNGTPTHRVELGHYEPVACSIGGRGGRTMAITAIESLEGKNIFEEMREKRVRAAVFIAQVPFEKRQARP